MNEGGELPPPWLPLPEQLLDEIEGRTNYNNYAPLPQFPRDASNLQSWGYFAEINRLPSLVGANDNNAATLATFPTREAPHLQSWGVPFVFLGGQENTRGNGNERGAAGGENGRRQRRSMRSYSEWERKWIQCKKEERTRGESEEWREDERDIKCLMDSSWGGGEEEDEEMRSTGHYSGGEEEEEEEEGREWSEETKEEMGRIIRQVLRGKDRSLFLGEFMDFFAEKMREEDEVRRRRRRNETLC